MTGSQLGVDGALDAYNMVRFDLDAYWRTAVQRLRTVQVAVLDARLLDVWPAASEPTGPNLRSARTALGLLEQRCGVRGLHYNPRAGPHRVSTCADPTAYLANLTEPPSTTPTDQKEI